MTKEEMKEFKREDNGNEFIKSLQKKYTAAFIKVIKITENWKVIGYFSNQKAMEEAVALSLRKNNLALTWLVQNFKTIFRSTKIVSSDDKTPSQLITI